MSPTLFRNARESPCPTTTTQIYSKPYNPTLLADASSPPSVVSVVLSLLFDNDNTTTIESLRSQLTAKPVTGGITNALYRVSGFPENTKNENNGINGTSTSVLVRIFGGEGLIDRDVETSTFAVLAQKGIAPPYLGRFGNGRIEGWLDGYVPLVLQDLQNTQIGDAIAVQLARLHVGFTVPEELVEYHNVNQPGYWTQILSWMDQAKNITEYKTPGDDERATEYLDLTNIATELEWLKTDGLPKDSAVAFCHNDVLAGNVMKHQESGTIRLIDFEYGGVNYVAFDIANHINEYAGGTSEEENGVPDYTLLPSPDRRRGFITAYVRADRDVRCGGNSAKKDDDDGEEKEEISLEEEVAALEKEVGGFLLANHLYWGLWAVNQASTEGTEEFDYLTYASNRFKQYYVVKEENYR